MQCCLDQVQSQYVTAHMLAGLMNVQVFSFVYLSVETNFNDTVLGGCPDN